MINHKAGQKGIFAAWRRKLFVGSFIGPAVLFVMVFAYWPIISTIGYSFHSWDGYSRTMSWVGFHNYQRLFSDPNFYHSFINNLLIIGASLLVQLPLAFFSAYLIYKIKSKWAEMTKVIFYIPSILSMVMIGLLWRFVFDYEYGTLNSFLRTVKLSRLTHIWLTDPQTAFGAIMFVVVWVYFGYHCIIHSAGLNSLPPEILEAAQIDGARGFVVIWRIIIPMISEVLRVSLIMSLIGSFQFFDLIWILTGGGPFHRTDVLATYMYNRAFQAHEFGYGGAIAVAILVCALGATLLQNLWQRDHAKGGRTNEI
ncbi:MAG: sugar ABC transporter permease [Bacillota bacterium]|jgi:raffinose/stachyose/melibiose transport system permease protein